MTLSSGIKNEAIDRLNQWGKIDQAPDLFEFEHFRHSKYLFIQAMTLGGTTSPNHCEERGDEAIHQRSRQLPELLRLASNDPRRMPPAYGRGFSRCRGNGLC